MNADNPKSRNYLKYSKYFKEKVMLESSLTRKKPHYILGADNIYKVWYALLGNMNRQHAFLTHLNHNREIKNLCQQ